MLRGVNPKLLDTLDIEVPADVTTASLAILQNEYKPIAVFEKDADTPGMVNIKTHWLASPSIKDVLNLKKFIENLIQRMNPQDPCNCAYKIAILKRKKFSILYGELHEDETRGKSLAELESRLTSLQAIIKKIGKDNQEHKELFSKYQQECWDVEQEVKEKKDSLANIEKELGAFPPGVPHQPSTMTDIEKCAHCGKEIAVPPLIILMDDSTYDKVSQLVLGIGLEEAGEIMPISQIKYLWACIVTWVFSLPSNLPNVFLEQVRKAMNMIQLSERMQEVIGLAEEAEKEVTHSENSGVHTISGL